MVLDKMEIGDRTLEDWRAADTLPAELDRLDAVDLLVGHDLLRPYRVTIDLRQRVIV